MVQNKLHWDANDAVGLPKQRNSYQSSPTFFCFESPTASFASQCNLFCTMWPDPAKGLLYVRGWSLVKASWWVLLKTCIFKFQKILIPCIVFEKSIYLNLPAFEWHNSSVSSRSVRHPRDAKFIFVCRLFVLQHQWCKWDVVSRLLGSDTKKVGRQAGRQVGRQAGRKAGRQTHRQTDGWTDGQTDTQADRQTDKQTDGRTDGRTNRQTDRQTDTDRQTGRRPGRLGGGQWPYKCIKLKDSLQNKRCGTEFRFFSSTVLYKGWKINRPRLCAYETSPCSLFIYKICLS